MSLMRNLLATGIALAGSIANADDNVAATMFATDISGSVGLLFDQGVADEIAMYVEGYIAQLDDPHRLSMISFGEPGLAHRVINIRATLTDRRASNAQTLSRQFAGYFRALPALVQSGDLTPQDTTSIVEFLQAIEPVCARGETRVVLFTDGVEWSATVDGPALMSGAINLPTPSDEFLSGCHVEMIGVGQVRGATSSQGLEQLLIPQWEQFLEAAGADSVLVLGSFFNF